MHVLRSGAAVPLGAYPIGQSEPTGGFTPGHLAVVALSGPDNVGKTTHARLLQHRTGARSLGPLDDYDRRWQHAKRNGLPDWWFGTAPIEEVADVLACSYLARSAAAQSGPPAPLILIDRGMTMLVASVAATIAVRDHTRTELAAERAHLLLAPYASAIAHAQQAEHEILLLHHAAPREGARMALSREPAITPVYRRYQHALNEHLAKLPPSDAIVAGERPILAVHADICATLTRPAVLAPTINDRWIIALGGLSECGKSTAGRHLQHEHGVTRLKIGYLLDLAAARHRLTDIYALPIAEQAELLAQELDAYAHAHHYQQTFSIESLHSHDLATELRKLLGDSLTTVYLDADPTVRATRGTLGPDDVTERDRIKRARGADRVRDIAQHVIDNNRSATELGHALDRLIRDRLWPRRSPRVVLPAELGLPDHLTGFLDYTVAALTRPDDTVRLIAITGSGARGKYLDGWSDLDVLIVADPPALPAIGAALRQARGRLAGVKLGLTVLAPAECQAGALTSRLLYTLAQIADGALPAIWAAPGFTVPHPDAATVTARTWRDGATAAMDLRRLLLREPIDVRAVYKVAALLAKIVLRCEGELHAADSDALVAFAKLASDLPEAPSDPRFGAAEQVTAMAEQVLAWWLASLESAV
ncbi:nucleotidyltransferase domain-containing protein [Nonomuraea sp. NPDC049625]|uniref:nucleotidyltransferase domain-containing protein n=1 Tax=Nonomuraea sp. NPDC049625 TaxID=3155775 RepID=UPI00341E5C0C